MTKQKTTQFRFSLPTILIMSLMMAANGYFFIVSMTSGFEQIAAWVWYAFIMIVFVLMISTGDVSRYRRILFVTFALTFFPTFIAMLLETRGHMYLTQSDVVNLETPFCHIVTTMAVIPYLLTQTVIFTARIAGHFAAIYPMLIIWLTATLTIGRGWCSWVCFYGGWDEGFSSFGKKPIVDINKSGDKLRYFNFVILAFVALASLATFTAIYCDWLCPFKLLTEYSQVTDMFSFLAMILFVVLFVGLVIVMPILTKKRFQCTTFCPFGAMQSLLDKVSLYRVRIDTDKCIECMACVKACPTLSMSEESIRAKTGKPLITCTKCGACISVCSKSAIKYTFAMHDVKKPSLLEKLEAKTSQMTGFFGVFLKGAAHTIGELFSARAMFVFTAFTFGIIISTGFSLGTIQRVINLFVNGSFLLK